MKIAFFGTPEFAAVSLRALLAAPQHDVAGVVTAPDKSAGRGRKLSAPPVKTVAEKHHLPTLQPTKLRDPTFIARLQSWNAECFAVVAFRILPIGVFAIPPRGCINVHGSLLPQYRGAAPIRWALFNGEAQTGVTTFLIQKKVDTGAILLTRTLEIGPEETHGELESRMAIAGAELLVETLDRWERKEVTPKQQDTDQVSLAPKITAEDRILHWDQPPATICNRIRGLSPKPGVQATFRETNIKILRAMPATDRPERPEVPAGTTVAADPKTGVVVAAAQGAVLLTEVQPAGKRPMSGAEFVRGYRVEHGEQWS